MTTKEITDRQGRRFIWNEYDGIGFHTEIVAKLMPDGIEAKINEIRKLEIRDDDLMICTFPKAG